jgi:hypothetical protein
MMKHVFVVKKLPLYLYPSRIDERDAHLQQARAR